MLGSSRWRNLLLVLILTLSTGLVAVRSPSVQAAPGPEVRLRAVAVGTNEVDLSWTVEPDIPVASFLIRRSGQDLATVEGTARTYVDTTVEPTRTYVYVLEARDAQGTTIAQSRSARVKAPERPERTDRTPPSPPVDFTVEPTDAGNLLDWYDASDDTDVTGYRIYRDGQVLATVDGATLSYLDTTADPAATHTYEVETLDPVGHKSKRARSDAPRRGNGPRVRVTPQGEESSAAAVATFQAVAYAPQLMRYPYLTDLVDRYVTINWATDRSQTTGSARWGEVQSDGSCTPVNTVTATRTSITVNSVPEYQWKAMLTLEPDKEYCYRVYLGTIDLLGSDPSPRFWTQVPAGSTKPFSFVVFGDWGYTNSEGTNPDQAALMQRIAESGARFALTVGDNAYSAGSQKNYGDLVQTGPSVSNVFGPEFWTVPGRSIPIFPATGNHGFASSNNPHPHLVNFPQDRAVALSSGKYVRETHCCLNGTSPGDYPSAWYAFDAGTVRIYNLTAAWADANVGTATLYENDYDYHWTASSEEYQWLEQDLAAHPDQVKLAVLHFPLYSDSSAQQSDTFLQGPDSLEGLLGRYGVKIAFTGHAHFYQRNHANADGLVTYITGGGGAKVASVNHCSPFNAYAIGWSFSKNQGSSCNAPPPTSPQQVYHFLLVTVNGTTITVTPTDENGRTFDVQTYTADGSGGGGGTYRFAPEADSWVDEAAPGTNNGTSARLRTDTSPDRREAFLRFAVNGLTGSVTSAKLRLYASDGSSNGPAVYAASNDWSETGVTWTNRPATIGGAVDDLGAITKDTWVEWDVTPLVTGNGTYTFAIIPTSSDGADFHSREGANKPQLVVTTGEPGEPGDPGGGSGGDTQAPTAPANLTATAVGPNQVNLTWTASTDNVGVTGYEIYRDGDLLTTVGVQTSHSDSTVAPATTYTYEVKARDAAGNVSPASNPASVTTPPDGSGGGATVTFTPEADSWVDEAAPGTNNGTSARLRTDTSPDRREAFLRFAVNGLTGSVTSAKLRLYASDGSSNGPAVYATSNDWSEMGLTWTNKPGPVGTPSDDLGSITKDTWVELDVTPLVTGNGTYSFILVPTSSDGADFHSRQGSNKPQLVVTTG